MAVVGYESRSQKLPKGMKIEVMTSEYIGTSEEPHFHLYPASHKNKNNDLITRVKVTDELPESVDDIVPIKGNNEVPKEYKKAIYEWSKKTNKRGVNNWIALQIFWDGLNNRI